MNASAKKWAKFTLRWGVAVAGIAWVLLHTSFEDRMHVRDPLTGKPEVVRVLGDAKETDTRFHVTATHGEAGGATERWIGRDQVVVLPDHPLIDVGLNRLVRQARPSLLIAALFVLPVSFLITSRRWHLLLEALEIHIGQMRVFVLNMVGAFYNTFMPGSTGGDLIKAYYASKYTTHRVRAVLSVIVDRVIGLLALVILGSVMAALQSQIPDCRRVARISALMLTATAVGLLLFYEPRLRRASGLDFVLKKLPMQRRVQHAVEAMELYGRRPGVALLALLISFPVHMTTILSATLAGMAFGLKLHPLYYWTVIPVIALVGAIPISPQGVGVMEFFAIALTRSQGVTVGQAFALTMFVRCGQMFWNLVAGIYVLRGNFHSPTQREQDAMEEDEDSEPQPAPALRADESIGAAVARAPSVT